MKAQILINPSILNADFNDLENEIAKVASTSDFLHLDIMDNIFVPNFTFDLNRALAIKPATLFDDVKRWIEEIDMLLIMTVEPGFGGQSFMHDQMPKVKQARSFIEKLLKAKPTLQIDGGVSLETIAEAAQAGANCFVAGSAVYKSDKPAEMVSNLRELAEKNYPY
ncbi:MAG: ribulose-phosphate 3-epimerase [Actinobacteria bacterium]|nr:ribulose-phosphate 3-epimerase [Actinomycetota bacterium]